jgi:DNA invertase Pin-like site-specific DNA recombinase
MLERQRDGIAKAKGTGLLQGPCADCSHAGCRDLRLKQEGVRPSEIASRLGIGRASVYRVLSARQTGGDRVAA